ncbi:hypothetical protein ACFL1I_01235 [Candidatus Omnitrophota bacterium]
MRNLKYLLLAVFLIGCAEIQPPGPKEIMHQPLGGSALRMGMAKEQVKSIWGEPDLVRGLDSNTPGTVKEEWVYRGRYPNLPINVDYLAESQYLVFDGNNLVEMNLRKHSK